MRFIQFAAKTEIFPDMRTISIGDLNDKEEAEDGYNESKIQDSMFTSQALCTEIPISLGLQSQHQTATES